VTQIQQSMQLIESLLAEKSVESRLRGICDAFELNNLAYFGLPSFGSLQTPPRLKVTYDSAWVDHYRQRRYAYFDPVLLEGMESGRMFEWSELNHNSKQVADFFGEAADFGVGTNGLTIPIAGQGSPIALVSFTSCQKSAEWHGFVEENRHSLQLLSLSLHEHVWQHEHADAAAERLSEREAECLKWAASGKTAFETSMIIGISERTVRHHLEMSRRKLDAGNITHAVVKAINANLLGRNF
jgi:DNA-binding CsgD family transcriptional regulator